MNLPATQQLPPVAPTGITGLDSILHGGFPVGEMHLVQGSAGTGKTTIALRFLLEAVRAGEACIYLTLSQSREHLERIARSHGWQMDGITIQELSPGAVADRIASRQTILPTAEVELGELSRDLAELVNRVKPRRAVIDSITILEMLAGSSQRYHREVVTLRQIFFEAGCTVLVLADHPGEVHQGTSSEVIFHPLCGCVINLDQEPRPYGTSRRRLRVLKARGLPNNGGYHDLKIRTGGMEVFPRLGAYDKPERTEYTTIASGLASLDTLLGGGLEAGTSCLIVGPSGVGKSTIAGVFVDAVARAGSRSAMFLLDERPGTCIRRSEGVSIPLGRHVESGLVLIEQLDPGEIAPGEFSQAVRRLVEYDGIRVVVIDSVVGYFAAMGSADVLMTQLHELLTYLTRAGVLLIMCGSQEGFMSIGAQHGVDVSYLSDVIVALRFFEHDARIRKCIAVVKKKPGAHATTIHELTIASSGISIELDPLMVAGPFFLSGPPAAGTRRAGDGAA